MIDTLALYAPEALFVEPYIKAALPGVTICSVDDEAEAAFALMISSTDIYGAGAHEDAGEDAEIDESSGWKTREDEFCRKVAEKGMKAVVLRCADIVGTGMTGFMRHLAEGIWRGTFLHFPGNGARRSVVHAVDLGRIACALADGDVTALERTVYNVTDGVNPTLHDLAEALAVRLGNKRISTLSTGPQQWFGRVVYGRRKYSMYTTTRTFSSAKLCGELTFSPTPVCEYMRTHNYDENSL